MPSNKDLIAQISEIGRSMGATQEEMDKAVNDLNNDKLAKLLKEAKAEKALYTASKTLEEVTKDNADAEKKPDYYVADGKSITCKKGVLDSGEEVRAGGRHATA